MRCAIVIPVHNQAALTAQCLDVLLAQEECRAHDVVVVDDASSDDTPRLLRGYRERVRVVTHARNLGFAATCNDGAAAAPASDALVFLNNDTIPQPGWLAALLASAAAHPAAAMIGSKLLYPNDTVQHAGVVVCHDRYPRHVYAGFPAAHPAVNKSRRFQIVTAACALVRRPAFEAVNGFDTAFMNGYEDVDLCLRLGEAGHEIRLCHESTLYHLEALSREERRQERDRNVALYRRRWMDRVRPDEFAYYLEDDLLRVEYADHYPIQLTVSPLLGAVVGQPEEQVGRILASRGAQVFHLLRQNIRLLQQLRDADHSRDPE